MESADHSGNEAIVTAPTSIVEQALRVHGHLEPHEYQGILRHWTSLDHRLQSFAGDAIDLQLFVNDRDTPSQHITLEVRIPGHRTLVASSARPAIGPALHDIRDSMVRQLTDLKTREQPRHSRELRNEARSTKTA
jgi:hypothetical protein